MSIHQFSKTQFIKDVKEIIKSEWILRNMDSLTPETSFREELDLTSLDIAEILVALEKKYNVDLSLAHTGVIDNINDLFATFNKIVSKNREQQLQNKIFNSIKSIITDRNGSILPDDIKPNTSFKFGLHADKLEKLEILMDFEKRYNIFIEDTSRIENAKQVKDICDILRNHMLYGIENIKTQKEVCDILNEYIQNKYHIADIENKSHADFRKDFKLEDSDITDVFIWCNKTFGIKLAPFYRELDINIYMLSKQIFVALNKQRVGIDRTSLFNRIKQKVKNKQKQR